MAIQEPQNLGGGGDNGNNYRIEIFKIYRYSQTNSLYRVVIDLGKSKPGLILGLSRLLHCYLSSFVANVDKFSKTWPWPNMPLGVTKE